MFVVNCHPRVGSELLIQSLKNHPEIEILSEIYNTNAGGSVEFEDMLVGICT